VYPLSNARFKMCYSSYKSCIEFSTILEDSKRQVDFIFNFRLIKGQNSGLKFQQNLLKINYYDKNNSKFNHYDWKK